MVTMIVEGHDRFRGAFRLPATRLVVRDDYGHPVAVLYQPDPANAHHVRVLHAGEPGFARQLEELGLGRTVVVTARDLGELRPPRVRR